MREWLARDPLARLETYLRSAGALDDAAAADVAAEAERFAEQLRTRMNTDVQPSTDDLFDHVYATPTAALQRQRADLAEELAR